MGWNYRKSINLGGGIRLNFSKSGVGISGGVKGFRVSHNSRGSRLYASIPGTGIYYTKNLSSKKGDTATKSNAGRTAYVSPVRQYQYSQVVTNQYTGESRELRARTQWELNELVRLEVQRQNVNEARQRAMATAQDMRQRVDVMNKQLLEVRNAYNSILKHTLKVNDRINWDAEMIKDNYPPFIFNEKPPEIQYKYKLKFWKSLFMKAETFELPEADNSELKAYEKRRNVALAEYLRKKADYERDKNTKNGETLYLKNRFEESDKAAVERYISLVLTKSSYPADFEHDFDVVYKKDQRTVIINYLFQNIDEFPIVESYSYNEATSEIDENMMSRQNALNFYLGVVYAVGIRTIHEIFESVYTDAVDTVCFNGFVVNDNTQNQCAFTMKSNRSTFETIDLHNSSLRDIIPHLDARATIKDFASDEQVKAYV